MLRHRDGQEAKSHDCRWGGSGEMKHKPAFTGKMYVFKGWEISCVLFLRIYREKLTLKTSVNRPFPVKCLSLTLVSAFSASWPQTDILKYSS